MLLDVVEVGGSRILLILIDGQWVWDRGRKRWLPWHLLRSARTLISRGTCPAFCRLSLQLKVVVHAHRRWLHVHRDRYSPLIFPLLMLLIAAKALFDGSALRLL